MVVSLSLNPSLDLSVSLKKIDYKDIIRIAHIQRDPSGKGLNIARIMHRLGVKTKALGFIGGYTGIKIKDLLDKEGIPNDFVWVDGDTRSNIAINLPKGMKQIKINEDGASVKEENLKVLYGKISSLKKNDYFVLTGSLPPGVKNNIYAKIIKLLHKKGIKTVLDADNEAFILGIKEKPFMIKPNIFEAQRFISAIKKKKYVISNEKGFIETALIFAKAGIKTVIVSWGDKGIVAAINGDIWRVNAPLRIERSGVGCGDGVVSGYLYGQINNFSVQESLGFAVASGTACTMREGSALCRAKDIRGLLKDIKVKKI